VLGIVAAPDHRAALGTYRAYFVEPVALFYIGVDMLRTRDDLRPFFIPSAVAAVIFSIGQIVSFAWVAAHHHLLLGDAPAFLNSSPNADALYLEPLLAFAVAFVAFPWTYRTRLVAGIVAVFVFVAMILTLSRAGYLAMTVLALVVVLRGVAPRWRYWVLAGLAVIAVIVLEVPFINQRVATIGASAGLRTSIYGQALRMLAQRGHRRLRHSGRAIPAGHAGGRDLPARHLAHDLERGGASRPRRVRGARVPPALARGPRAALHERRLQAGPVGSGRRVDPVRGPRAVRFALLEERPRRRVLDDRRPRAGGDTGRSRACSPRAAAGRSRAPLGRPFP
jgi:hypothetical protein